MKHCLDLPFGEIKSFIFGKVIAKNWISSNGRCLVIQGTTSKNLYMLCHLSNYGDISVNNFIKPGDVVAYTGRSGGTKDNLSETAASSHLHVSVIPCDLDINTITKDKIKIEGSDSIVPCSPTETWINLKPEYKKYIDPFDYNFSGGWMFNYTSEEIKNNKNKYDEE